MEKNAETCAYIQVVRQCKKPARKWHIWFFPTQEPTLKKPKEPFFANARQNSKTKMDKLTKEQRRKNMQAVKSKGSKIETLLAKELWKRGHRYRRNNKTVFGKPDLSFKKYKIAIFVDSEFWHGKDWEERKKDHKSNEDFWHKKIERNIERDKEVNDFLLKTGWQVLRFWGRQIETELVNCVQKIENTINEAKRENIT